MVSLSFKIEAMWNDVKDGLQNMLLSLFILAVRAIQRLFEKKGQEKGTT